MNKFTKDMLSTRKYELYKQNAEVIQFLRNNPVVAAEQLLGVKLLDYQKYILQMTWNTQYSIWTLSRNASKTFEGAVLIMLKQLLYEDGEIYIVAPTGKQSKNLFQNIEKIATDSVPTIDGLKDIYIGELQKHQAQHSGFRHDPSSFEAKCNSGTVVKTLNGIIDNNRGSRSSLIFFDEVGFSSEEQITVTEAFGTTNASFVTSTNELFDTSIIKDKIPKQFIYASSASDKTTYYWRLYKNFAKRMFIGDRRYFLIDINVDVPLNPTMDGKPYPPLLDKSLPEKMMKTNPSKAMREYYNIFDSDSGDEQIIKSSTIAKNETFYLPKLSPKKDGKYIFSIDPAYRHDNSIMTVAELCYDEEDGYFVEISNMVNFQDYANELKLNIQMLPPKQIELVREYIKTYNNNARNYNNIDSILIDLGAGGSGNSQWLPTLLYDWVAKDGTKMNGLIDSEYHIDKLSEFPKAINKVYGISPQKLRNDMVQDFIDMMELGLIRFAKSYNGSPMMQFEDEDGELIIKNLTLEEQLALINFDIAKEECKMIHKVTDFKTRKVSYSLRKDMRNKIHDDRWYTLIMIAYRLATIRREEEDGKHCHKNDKTDLEYLSQYLGF